jgi:hypothetical protein
MVTQQFIEAGKKNLEKCPTRHGKKNAGAGRPKSLLKNYMAENDVCKEDVKKACEYVLFNFTYGGLKEFVVKERDKAPALIIILAETLLNDAKKGRMNNVEQMLNIIFGKGQLAQKKQEDIDFISNEEKIQTLVSELKELM